MAMAHTFTYPSESEASQLWELATLIMKLSGEHLQVLHLRSLLKPGQELTEAKS
jgi:hypothetical protein